MSADNFQSWVERLARDENSSKPLTTGEVVKSSAGEPFGAVSFARIEKAHFIAEVGKKGKHYIYHFYPNEKWLGAVAAFMYPVKDAFEELFKDHGEVEIDWVEEMMSWAFKVSGWTDHIWGDELAVRVIEVADEKLTAHEAKFKE